MRENASSPTPAPLSFAHASFGGLIGVGRADMTPPANIYARNWGAAKHDAAEGIHRPLLTTVLSFQDQSGAEPLLLVGVDLIGWWGPEEEWFVRGALLEAFSLDPARLMLNAAHTHSGPNLRREAKDRPGGEHVGPYLERLREAVLNAARQALKNRTEATLTWRAGRCALAQNRDLPDPQKERILCGYHPGAPADDTLLLGRVTGTAGKILATIVNYACHPVTLAWQNKLISPDYPGALRELVESRTDGAPCLFLQGASGELGPREQYVGEVEIADAHGREVGFAALSVLEGMLPPNTRLEYAGPVESGAPLAAWERRPDAPSRTLRAARSEVALDLKAMPTLSQIEEQLKHSASRVQTERLQRLHGRRRQLGDGSRARVPLWAWQVGDAFLVGHPNEAYSLLQTELRRRLAPRTVAVMNLVNGSCGYLPPAELYEKDIYQVWVTPFAAGCLEKTIGASETAIRKLAAGD